MTRRLRPSTIVLVASLALNGFLGAYLLVGARGSLVTLPPSTPVEVLAGMARRLPDADGAILREAAKSRAASLEELSQVLRATQAQVLNLLREPEVDARKLQVALQEARDTRVEGSEMMIAVLAEALPRMSLATRRRIADALEARH